MKMMINYVVGTTLALTLVACTSVDVKPVNPSLNLSHVCIQDNPEVIVQDFVPVLRDGFKRHNISTEVISGTPPTSCEYVLTYTALQSVDFLPLLSPPYLSHAELRLEHDGRQIASATYHLKGKGGFLVTKFYPVKRKMDPIIDEMLHNYVNSECVSGCE